jgi:hypothetical protein
MLVHSLKQRLFSDLQASTASDETQSAQVPNSTRIERKVGFWHAFSCLKRLIYSYRSHKSSSVMSTGHRGSKRGQESPAYIHRHSHAKWLYQPPTGSFLI